MKPPKSDMPVVVIKHYDLCLWIIRKVEDFPRSYRQSIGERLVAIVLDIQMRLVDAAYTREPAAILTEVNRMLNRLRYLLRFAKDLRLLTIDSYGHASELTEEVGRMVGGWRKAGGAPA